MITVNRELFDKLKALQPFKYSGNIQDKDGNALIKANRQTGTTPLTPHERDELLKLIMELLTGHLNGSVHETTEEDHCRHAEKDLEEMVKQEWFILYHGEGADIDFDNEGDMGNGELVHVYMHINCKGNREAAIAFGQMLDKDYEKVVAPFSAWCKHHGYNSQAAEIGVATDNSRITYGIQIWI